jgi:hypothetical protein
MLVPLKQDHVADSICYTLLMAGFDKEQLAELKELLSETRSAIMFDMRSLIQAELQDIRERLDRLAERTNEESTLALKQIEQLKKRLAHAEHEIATLKAA